MRVVIMDLNAYNPWVNLEQARKLYFQENGFGEDGGYSKPTATVYLFGRPVSFPNTEGRKRAVVYHDMHHILTGYRTNNLGEAEISAWELGSECFDYRFAWGINTLGLVLGIFKSPMRIFQAFLRGRRSRNLYGGDVERFLRTDVESLRAELGLSSNPGHASLIDVILFFVYLSLSLSVYIVPICLLFWFFCW